MKILRHIKAWFTAVAEAFADTWHRVLHDAGALIFFIGLPFAYPIVYTLVYNPEVVREIPIVVVDHDRTATSRTLVRQFDATDGVDVIDYAPDVAHARNYIAENTAYAILEIPKGYGRKTNRLETAHSTLYCDMSLLLRYRALATAVADLQIKQIGDITAERAETLGLSPDQVSMPMSNNSVILGDTQQGFASFIMPAIVVLILQQSMLLGILLLMGTSNEKRRLLPASERQYPGGVTLGRALCFTTFYIAPTIYVMQYIPVMFNLPHVGSPLQFLLLPLPFLLASAFLGLTLGQFVRDRESTFLIVVVTSVFFLFLSGITWPRYAFPQFWAWVSDLVPATWGVEAFVRINSNNATLADNSRAYLWLWGLTILYAITATLLQRLRTRRSAKETEL